MSKKLFIFDLDGTLLNAYPAIIESMNYTLRRLKYPQVEPIEIIRAVGYGNYGLLKMFVKEEDVSAAKEIYREHHQNNLRGKVSLLPGALSLLQILRAKGKLLAVATNRPADTALRLLQVTEIDHYFDRVLAGEEVKSPKPAPDIILALLDYFQVSRKGTLYLGDMTIDAQTGAAAGVETVIVTTGSSTREEIEAANPDLIINSLEEFPSLRFGIK